MTLRFSKANTKLKRLYDVPELSDWLTGKRKIYSFDLLSGWSCPFAKLCRSKAIVGADGKRKIQDGKHTQFRCFSASQEAQYPDPYRIRKGNFDFVRDTKLTAKQLADAILEAMPKDAGIVRIHVAGDFLNPTYFLAWMMVAQSRPDVLFYAYTKSIRYWLEYRNVVEATPNFVLTASYGGADDELIDKHGLRSAVVILDEDETELEIDHDDSHAARPDMRDQSFALLIHGTQPKGSAAGKAVKKLKGKGSYGKKATV